MLRQLLEIKRHRERGIRIRLTSIDEEELSLDVKAGELKARQRELRAEWQRLACQSGQFNQSGFGKLRAELERTERSDKALTIQLDGLAHERISLGERRVEQQQLLRKNLREQEKFAALVEGS